MNRETSMPPRWWRGAVSGVAIALMAATMMASSPADAQDCAKGKLRIYASLPMQGMTRAEAIGLKNGLELAVAEAGGAVAGYCLEVVALDGDSPQTTIWDPVIEARNAAQAVGDPEAIAYVGPFSSAATRISMPITNRAFMAQIGISATYPGLTRRGTGTADGEPWIYRPLAIVNYFRLVIAADVQAEAAVRWAQRLGVKQVFVVHDGETYGQGIAAAFEAYARKVGLPILANEPLDRAQPDHGKLLAKIRASGADLVYMGGRSSTGAPSLIRQMAKAGLVAPRVRFLGPGQLLADEVLEEATCVAALATEMRVTLAGVHPTRMTGTGLDTYQAYVTKFGEVRGNYDLNAVEAGRVLVDGIRRAADALGRAETPVQRRDAVRRAIAATSAFNGINGGWSFDRNGDVDYQDDERDAAISGFQVVGASNPAGCAFQLDGLIGR
jgi:branched-chain amino acid transport system substrate-binding protein